MRALTILILLIMPGTVAAARLGVPSQAQAGSESNLAIPLHLPAVIPPAFSEGIFPCSDCHSGMPPDLRRRELQDEHTVIFLRHAAGQFWCLDCHSPESRDSLRLTSGESIPFTESYRLCGQCHGKKLLDWRIGLHGKRTGYWNGDKEYLLCTHCHNPHDPKFKALQPQPPPERPGRTGD